MKILFIAILATVLLVGCATTPTQDVLEKQVQAALVKEVHDEMEVGRTLAARLLRRFKPVSNKSALEYVNLVGATLVSQLGRPELTYRFGILNTEEIHSYACPGGYIFVTKGLLKVAQNESELAVVLAREMAHIQEKHLLQGVKASADGDASWKILLTDGYGLETEAQADQAGVLFAAAVGYDPTALLTIVRRMGNGDNLSRVSKANPPSPARISQIKAFLATNKLSDRITANRTVMENRFYQSLRKNSL